MFDEKYKINIFCFDRDLPLVGSHVMEIIKYKCENMIKFWIFNLFEAVYVGRLLPLSILRFLKFLLLFVKGYFAFCFYFDFDAMYY